MTSLWTDDVTTALVAYADNGLTASQIATALNERFELRMTRNAVIGKLHRMDGAALKTPAPVKKPREAKPRPAVDRRRIAKPKPRWTGANPMFCDAILPHEGGVTLMELRYTSCRYPYGDPTEDGFRFCGAARATLEPNRNYCAGHEALVYQPKKDQRRWDRRLGIPRE